MTERGVGMRRSVLCACALALVALSALGSWYVARKSEAAAVAAFANRFIPFEDMAFAPSDPSIEARVSGNKLEVEWQGSSADELCVASADIPLEGGRRTQLDMYIGGDRNIYDGARVGYGVWLTLRLYGAAGEAVASESAEVYLQSEKERARLYSLVASGEAAYCRVELAIRNEGGAIAPGALLCSFAEVIER